jgi:hypothetical protein
MAKETVLLLSSSSTLSSGGHSPKAYTCTIQPHQPVVSLPPRPMHPRNHTAPPSAPNVSRNNITVNCNNLWVCLPDPGDLEPAPSHQTQPADDTLALPPRGTPASQPPLIK